MSNVDHPRHYNAHKSGVECIALVEPLGFCVGNAVKYVWRAGLKCSPRSEPTVWSPGSPATESLLAKSEDLEKAAWYLRRATAPKSYATSPSVYLLDLVLAHEPEGSLLGDVLRMLFSEGHLNNFFVRVNGALERVERELLLTNETRCCHCGGELRYHHAALVHGKLQPGWECAASPSKRFESVK